MKVLERYLVCFLPPPPQTLCNKKTLRCAPFSITLLDLVLSILSREVKSETRVRLGRRTKHPDVRSISEEKNHRLIPRRWGETFDLTTAACKNSSLATEEESSNYNAVRNNFFASHPSTERRGEDRSEKKEEGRETTRDERGKNKEERSRASSNVAWILNAKRLRATNREHPV